MKSLTAAKEYGQVLVTDAERRQIQQAILSVFAKRIAAALRL